MHVFQLCVLLYAYIYPDEVLEIGGEQLQVFDAELAYNKQISIVDADDNYVQVQQVSDHVQKVTFQNNDIAFINEDAGVINLGILIDTTGKTFKVKNDIKEPLLLPESFQWLEGASLQPSPPPGAPFSPPSAPVPLCLRRSHNHLHCPFCSMGHIRRNLLHLVIHQVRLFPLLNPLRPLLRQCRLPLVFPLMTSS